MNKEYDLYKMAADIIAIDPWEARDADLNPETLSEELKDITVCYDTIKYLLSIIYE